MTTLELITLHVVCVLVAFSLVLTIGTTCFLGRSSAGTTVPNDHRWQPARGDRNGDPGTLPPGTSRFDAAAVSAEPGCFDGRTLVPAAMWLRLKASPQDSY